MADSVPATMIIGGFTDCETGPEVQELGKLAVDEYNKEQGTNLVFKGAIKAQVQIVNGSNYRMFLMAKEADVDKICKTLVYESYDDSFKLLEFNFVDFDD